MILQVHDYLEKATHPMCMNKLIMPISHSPHSDTKQHWPIHLFSDLQ